MAHPASVPVARISIKSFCSAIRGEEEKRQHEVYFVKLFHSVGVLYLPRTVNKVVRYNQDLNPIKLTVNCVFPQIYSSEQGLLN